MYMYSYMNRSRSPGLSIISLAPTSVHHHTSHRTVPRGSGSGKPRRASVDMACQQLTGDSAAYAGGAMGGIMMLGLAVGTSMVVARGGKL